MDKNNRKGGNAEVNIFIPWRVVATCVISLYLFGRGPMTVPCSALTELTVAGAVRRRLLESLVEIWSQQVLH